MIAFNLTIVSTWQAFANGMQSAFLNGGPRSIVWGFVVAGLCTLTVVLSLAEMASITPSVGAQYRWTAIYCPKFLPARFFSFIQGWLTVWAWIVSTTLLPYFTASQILGVVSLSHETYSMSSYHVALTGIAMMAIPVIANLYTLRILKSIEIFGAIWHFVALITILFVMGFLGQRNSATFVFFGDSAAASGWQNEGIRWCLGMLAAVLPLTGEPLESQRHE